MLHSQNSTEDIWLKTHVLQSIFPKQRAQAAFQFFPDETCGVFFNLKFPVFYSGEQQGDDQAYM